jgi:hypothetical protein
MVRIEFEKPDAEKTFNCPPCGPEGKRYPQRRFGSIGGLSLKNGQNHQAYDREEIQACYKGI